MSKERKRLEMIFINDENKNDFQSDVWRVFFTEKFFGKFQINVVTWVIKIKAENV